MKSPVRSYENIRRNRIRHRIIEKSLCPMPAIPGFPQAEGATVAKLYILPVLKKTAFKQGVRHEMPARWPFRCRYSLQNRAAGKATKVGIMI
jgi:hypothetical protein